jgi:FMN phosphatase YigB (HAD superfamily)
LITTLLFDLDDTLLGNDVARFVPAYLQAFVDYLSLGADGRKFAAEVMAGTQAMLANTDPARTLQTVFDAHFFPAMQWDRAAWLPRLEAFYRERYPALQSLVTVRPAARAVLDWARSADLQIVIATNPLFPLFAVEERLRWAGLAGLPLALVTSYETSHFAKPHPAYYAEILGKLGRRPDEALLIGNDWERDIVPAAAVGMATYWIAPAGSAAPNNQAQPLGVGMLEDFLSWARVELQRAAAPALPAAALPHLLAGHLAAARAALADLPAGAWLTRPGAGEWSLTEIVCHLRDVEREVNGERLKLITGMDDPFIAAVDSDPWAEARQYQAQSGPQALAAFTAARKRNVAFLAALPAEAWQRPARHSALGPTQLAEIVGFSLDHDRIHLEQLRETVKRVSR